MGVLKSPIYLMWSFAVSCIEAVLKVCLFCYIFHRILKILPFSYRPWIWFCFVKKPLLIHISSMLSSFIKAPWTRNWLIPDESFETFHWHNLLLWTWDKNFDVLLQKCTIYWPRLLQNQKPKVEICSMALIFYNETNFMTKNSKMGKHKI